MVIIAPKILLVRFIAPSHCPSTLLTKRFYLYMPNALFLMLYPFLCPSDLDTRPLHQYSPNLHSELIVADLTHLVIVYKHYGTFDLINITFPPSLSFRPSISIYLAEFTTRSWTPFSVKIIFLSHSINNYIS